jgi:hypothetical protein
MASPPGDRLLLNGMAAAAPPPPPLAVAPAGVGAVLPLLGRV